MNPQVNIKNFRFPFIETERLLLRCFEAGDLDFVCEIFNDEEVQKYLSPANRRTRTQLQTTLQNLVTRWTERNFGLWCVCEKTTGKAIGYCGFQYFVKPPEVEILFGFLKQSWGFGLAGEAADACLRYGFEKLFFGKVFAATHPENAASQIVLEKIGMRFDKRIEQYRMNLMNYFIYRENYHPKKIFYKLTCETLGKFQIDSKKMIQSSSF